ncbi:MAG TPA: lipocalin-like domain-containing protein [Terrimicrobiaceae bacterium]
MSRVLEAAVFCLCILAGNIQADWRPALPGWNYKFPDDHQNHPEFKTEWWYFTGNLTTAQGRQFGYQLTFFRQGVMPRDSDIIPLSHFVTSSVKFAHFAVSDLSGGKFHFFQKLSRGAFGEAGFGVRPRLAWIDDWWCTLEDESAFRIKASAGDLALDLALTAKKPLVIHGRNGVSQKADGEGKASHYYSFTRLASEGVLRLRGEEFSVSGSSWFDHEWASNQLTANQSGWDWFSLQLEDGSDLMLFQIRTKDGGRDRNSAGTLVDANGTVTSLGEADFTLEALETWSSPESGGDYPVRWRIVIPRLQTRLEVTAALKDQELRLKPIMYWEGSIRAQGTIGEKNVNGSGYLEMTGYSGPVAGIQAEP